MGPTTLFDKSFIQSLSIDESVWYNHFYINNICPLFYVETLADLSKEMSNGRTAEDVVGNIADKTPEGGLPNVFHLEICLASLYGEQVPMVGQIFINAGKPVKNQDKAGLLVEGTPENLALARWRERKFEEVERDFAREWRTQIKGTKLSNLKECINYLPDSYKELKNLEQIASFVDRFLADKKYVRNHALLVKKLQYISIVDMSNIMRRWQYMKHIPIVEFAPYASYVLKVDLVFILAMYKGIISDQRPSNGIDVDYLKYLPFSYVFVSQDRLHRMLFPYVKNGKQQFLWGIDLKTSLKRINEFFLELPEEVRKKGINYFATYPPTEFDNLVTQSWEVFRGSKLPRGKREYHEPKPNPELVKRMNDLTPATKAEVNISDPDFITIKKQVNRRKGSWQIIPDDVE